jgi:hypothetical protein
LDFIILEIFYFHTRRDHSIVSHFHHVAIAHYTNLSLVAHYQREGHVNCKWTKNITRFVEREKTTASICILYFWSSGSVALTVRNRGEPQVWSSRFNNLFSLITSYRIFLGKLQFSTWHAVFMEFYHQYLAAQTFMAIARDKAA